MTQVTIEIRIDINSWGPRVKCWTRL